jgi:hypothetical protein
MHKWNHAMAARCYDHSMAADHSLLTGYQTAGPGREGDNVSGSMNAAHGYAVSTLVGAFPWYWTVTADGRLLQGNNVFELCRQADMAWRWSDTAISQIALVGHTLGTHTLHRNIYRLPPDCRLSFAGGKARLDKFDSFAQLVWGQTNLDERLCDLPESFKQCIDSSVEPILSLSGGYDSRVLLALCKHFGCRPLIVTMGSAHACDVKLAKLLARRVGASVQQIELRPEDYVSCGEEISRTTSGVKTAADWHTWLYNKQLNEPTKTHLVGSNGEFARTFFTDAVTRRPLFRASGRIGAQAWLWLKAANRLRKYPKSLRRAGAIKLAGILSDLKLPPTSSPRNALDCLDVFYATQRVHHFIGSGLACYSQFCRPKSPFLHRRWIENAAALKRCFKERSRYHCAVVDKVCPELSSLPYNRDPDGGVALSYSPFDEVALNPDVEQLLIESSHLDHVSSRRARIEALGETAHRRNTVSFLLTMHFAGMNAAKCRTS